MPQQVGVALFLGSGHRSLLAADPSGCDLSLFQWMHTAPAKPRVAFASPNRPPCSRPSSIRFIPSGEYSGEPLEPSVSERVLKVALVVAVAACSAALLVH